MQWPLVSKFGSGDAAALVTAEDACVGDRLRVVTSCHQARAAFESEDLDWGSHLEAYLGAVGVVVEVEEDAVRLKHEVTAGNELVWWAYGALRVVCKAGASGARCDEDMDGQVDELVESFEVWTFLMVSFHTFNRWF